MFTEILVPYDGSEQASRALSAAIDLAVDPQPVTITVLQVTNTDNVDKTAFEVAAHMAGLTDDRSTLKLLSDEYAAARKEQAQAKVAEFFEQLPENVNIKIAVERGDPREVVCEYAKKNDIDCIIMGRRGLGGFRATLGSVSTAVLRYTELPVMVVR